MLVELRRGDGRGGRPEEELEQRGLAELRRRRALVGEPVPQRRAPGVRQRVVLAPAAGLLAADRDEAGRGQPVGLGVELRVRDAPEAADAAGVTRLELVGRRLPGEGQEAEDDVRRRGEGAWR